MKIKTAKEENGVTTITIATELGEFTGVARFNSELDPLEPSVVTGGKIAENRAKTKYYKQKIKLKKNELKGVRRAASVIPGDKKIINLEIAIMKELLELKEYLQAAQHEIDVAIEGRSMYIRSRTMDRQARKEFFDQLGQAIKDLNTLNKKVKQDKKA